MAKKLKNSTTVQVEIPEQLNKLLVGYQKAVKKETLNEPSKAAVLVEALNFFLKFKNDGNGPTK